MLAPIQWPRGNMHKHTPQQVDLWYMCCWGTHKHLYSYTWTSNMFLFLVVAFSSLARFWGECSTIHSPPAFFFLFFFYVEIILSTLIPLFTPGSVHSGSAGWDHCGRVFPDKLHVSQLPDRFPHYTWTAALSAHSDFLVSRVYTCLGITCHLHFSQNDPGLLCATAGTQGGTDT